MSLFKVQYFFDANNGFGWNEKMYFDAPDYATVQAAVNVQLPLRLAMLPSTMKTNWIRISVPGLPPDALGVDPGTAGQGTYAPIGGIQMPIDTALLIELFASPTEKNRLFMRGFFAVDISGDNFTPSGTWGTAFTAWANNVITAGWQYASTYVKGTPQSFDPIISASWRNLTNRKTGRPFGLRRGRVRTTLLA